MLMAALSYVENGGSQRFLKPVVEYFKTMPLARIDQEAIERGARKTYPGSSNATLAFVLAPVLSRGPPCGDVLDSRGRKSRSRSLRTSRY